METLVLAALMLMDPLKSGTIRSTVPSPATVRVEQRLCRGRLRAVQLSPYGGMSIKFMLRFVGGGKAVFKPNQTLYSARYAAEIAWETEVWIADQPDHMIHFNGLKFLDPYK